MLKTTEPIKKFYILALLNSKTIELWKEKKSKN